MFQITDEAETSYTTSEYAETLLDLSAEGHENRYEVAKKLLTFALNVYCLSLVNEAFNNSLKAAMTAHKAEIALCLETEHPDDGGNSIDDGNYGDA